MPRRRANQTVAGQAARRATAAGAVDPAAIADSALNRQRPSRGTSDVKLKRPGPLHDVGDPLRIEGTAPERPARLALRLGARDANVLEHAIVEREQGASLPGELVPAQQARDGDRCELLKPAVPA